MALPLAAIVLILTVAGALWITRFASEVRRDPGLVYRDPGTLDRLLKRGHDAEAAGDRGTAITTYRFVVAVGAGLADLHAYRPCLAADGQRATDFAAVPDCGSFPITDNRPHCFTNIDRNASGSRFCPAGPEIVAYSRCIA